MCFFFLILSVAFNGRLNQGERKRDKEAEDQPEVDHLGVRRWWELLYLAGEDCRHHQHDGQVDRDGVSKEVRLEEYGDEGDEKKEDGGQEGGQQLGGDLPLQQNLHDHKLVKFAQGQIFDREHGQVCVLWQNG